MPFALRPFASAVFRLVALEPTVRTVIARSKKPGTTPKDWFQGINDDTWFWMNTTGRRRRKAIAALVAQMPPVTMQENFTGSHGDATLGEGFNAYKLFKDSYQKHIGAITDARAVLDFGCGWGRTIRFFLKDIPPNNLFGLDYSEEALAACRSTNKWCQFVLIKPNPPTPLPSESFDLIYLYSVFSHLPEDMHWALLNEFHRLLTPGGMLIATTRARSFIQECKTLRENLESNRPWQQWEAQRFADDKASFSAYDHGQFCYDSHNQPQRPFWGEACIPKTYVENKWTEMFDLCDYIDDPKTCPQNVIVVRKRPNNFSTLSSRPQASASHAD
jgi:SAM-dependent methyltransferase